MRLYHRFPAGPVGPVITPPTLPAFPRAPLAIAAGLALASATMVFGPAAGPAHAAQRPGLALLSGGETAVVVQSTAFSLASSSSASSTSASSPSRPATPGDTAVAEAKKYLGTPYRRGGASHAGVDCSGLTMLAWRAAGVSLPHSSSAQHRDTRSVPLSELQPGDLVFYYRGLSHVAIYIGDGQVIQALHTGTRVAVYSIDYAGQPVAASRP